MRWNPVAPLLAPARERAAAWMRRRQGADLLPVALERRRLYILPTGTGVAFAALLFLMLIAGLNYGNSLALFLTFLLGAFALVAMQQCHRNLLGIAVLTVSAPAVFARARGAVHVTLANPAGLARYAVEAPHRPRRRGAALAARALGGRRRSSRRAVRARASRGVGAGGSRPRAPPSLPRRARAVWNRRPCRQPPRLRSTGGSRRSRGRARPSRAGCC